MKLLYILIISLIIFASFYCENPTNQNTSQTSILDNTLVVAYHDTLFDNIENIWISFDSLITDSRCPQNVFCIWEGNAQVSFIFSKDSEEVKFILNTYHDFIQVTKLFDYHIALLDVMPYPFSDSSYVKEDYSAKILITK